MEKYYSSTGLLRFIDSAQFLLASLDKVVAANKPEAFQITAQNEPVKERRELLLRKGVYPYEYMDAWERLEERKPPRRKCGRFLATQPWGTTMTSITGQTSSCLPMCTRPFGRPV